MYRSVWKCSVVVAGVAGVWESVHTWSFGGALFLFLFLGLTAGCIRLVVGQEGDRPPWRPAMRTGVSWGAGTLAAFGLLAWLGVTGLIVVAALALLSPQILAVVIDRGGHRRRHAPSTPDQLRLSGDRADLGARSRVQQAREPSVMTAPSFLRAPWIEQPMAAMNDATLCFAWRTSYVALQQPLPVSMRLRIVNRRQEFLDEFERRNARGFEAWLASGARAAGDPTKYIAAAEWQARRDQR